MLYDYYERIRDINNPQLTEREFREALGSLQSSSELSVRALLLGRKSQEISRLINGKLYSVSQVWSKDPYSRRPTRKTYRIDGKQVSKAKWMESFNSEAA
jgi:hypothetical protein